MPAPNFEARLAIQSAQISDLCELGLLSAPVAVKLGQHVAVEGASNDLTTFLERTGPLCQRVRSDPKAAGLSLDLRDRLESLVARLLSTSSTSAQPFEMMRAADLPDADPERQWLVEKLWLYEGVGLVGAAPKLSKTLLAIDLAVSVASGTSCLGTFAVRRVGPVVVYCAEDTLADLKTRVRFLCELRGVALEQLEISFIAEPRIDLADMGHCARLERSVAERRPALLVLDPLVRIFSGSEDDSRQVSRVLGFLRKVQREHHAAVLLVHHNSKRSDGGGHALRGSGDFHAWTDSGLFLSRTESGDLRMFVEHRSAAPPDPIRLRLNRSGPMHLEVVPPMDGGVVERAERDLKGEIVAVLRAAPSPMGRTEIRDTLKVNNSNLGMAMAALAAVGTIVEKQRKWMLAARSVPPAAPREHTERNAELPQEPAA